jgi:hypothetical protein
LIGAEAAWQPRPKPEALVHGKVAWGEADAARRQVECGKESVGAADQTVKLGLPAQIIWEAGIYY